MALLSPIFRWIVYGNYWIASGAAAMLYCTYLISQIHPEPELILAVFCGTLSVYTFHRIFRIRSLYTHVPSERHQWLIRNQWGLWFQTLISGGLGAWLAWPFAFRLPPVLWGVFGLISLLYVIPVFKYRGRWWRLRDVPGMKIWLITLVWAGITVLPVPFTGNGMQLLLHLLLRALFVFAITMPFDIRDLEHDRASGVLTLASFLGVDRCLWWSRLLLALFAALAVGAYLFHWMSAGAALASVISAASTGWMIARIDEDAPEWVYAFWLDGALLDQCFWMYLMLVVLQA